MIISHWNLRIYDSVSLLIWLILITCMFSKIKKPEDIKALRKSLIFSAGKKNGIGFVDQ